VPGWPLYLEAEVTGLIALKDQNVLVLGLGASGLGMARWCARQGALVTVADTRQSPPSLDALKADVPAAVFIPGPFEQSLVTGKNFSQVFVSPGLSPESVAPALVAEDGFSVPTAGELSLFAAALAELKLVQNYAPKLLAITGTNGKTTVASLTGQLVERAGKSVAVAGNIGPTLLDTLSQRLDGNALPEVWVMELSSFQLQGVKGFEPTAATVLNISQDHLDWHGSMQAYAAAKANVFGSSGLMVLNREDAAVMAMLPAPAASSSARDRKVKERQQTREYVTFGGNLPARPGDFGIEEVNGMAWLVRAQESDGERRKRNEAPQDLFVQRLMPADALRIRGRHNAVNALTALALASAAGCALAPMLYGLREYRGEPHRVESVGTVNGVEFFDDSKGTNVGATIAALNGLGAERKLVVILGGEGKGQDFSPLAGPVARFARAVVLIGRDAPLIRAALDASGVALAEAASMEQAVAIANRAAHAGDAVLMSPACASFDMFDNYGHRAAVFCDAVMALADENGVVLEGQM
jgi:UDP-N-acetylmuramoylalanine--D-glutamate ligase